MLELAILGLLKERPMHGYDLRKRLREYFGALSHLSFGSLYPALGRLESSGAVRTVSYGDTHEPDVIVPLTGSLGGERAATIARRATAKAAFALGGHGTRSRKVYEITDNGQALFERLLAVPDVADGDVRGFSLRLAFARHLSPSARVRLLEQRRNELVDAHIKASRSLAQRQPELDSYGRSLAEHSVDTLSAEISWIESLLEAETPPMRSQNGTTRSVVGSSVNDKTSLATSSRGAGTSDGRMLQ